MPVASTYGNDVEMIRPGGSCACPGRLLATLITAMVASPATFAAEPPDVASCPADGPVWPSSPQMAVDRADASRHLDTLYLPVYRPDSGGRWRGNLYRFRLRDGLPVGADDLPALEAGTGALRVAVKGEWPGNSADDPLGGGAAARLPDHETRRLYTAFSTGAIARPGNRIHPDNPALLTMLPDLLPDLDADGRTRAILWARGQDVHDSDGDDNREESRSWMGAAVESAPALQVDGDGEGVVYLATREGLLHAFDTGTGTELWAYAPATLLPRLLDSGPPADPFGLDGMLRLHRLPGMEGAPDRVVLVFGMGRGGDRVHGLDVSDPLDPVLLWELHPGLAAFADLGDTWSTPVVATATWQGREHATVFFGGGHDPVQEAPGFHEDRRGNGVYAVDLLTGERLWSAGPPDARTAHALRLPAMRHSIPSELRVLDTDGDGLADRIYTGDTGGRLWRLDLPTAGSPGGNGGVLASLGGAAAAPAPPDTELRRFYMTPDAVPLVVGGRPLIALSLGSGYRARLPDTTIAEAFYSVRDVHAFLPLRSADYPPPVLAAELVDVTGQASPLVGPAAPGWRLRLVQAPGEKALSPPFTLGHTTFFTSFAPSAATGCGLPRGTTRFYAVSVRDGAPTTGHDEATDDAPGGPAVTVRLVEGGVPLMSLRRLHSGTGLFVCAGAHCLAPDALALPAPPRRWRTYWYQADSRGD